MTLPLLRSVLRRRPGPIPAAARGLLAAAALLCAACSTQRWPGPMEPEEEPLPPGARDLYAPGPEQVSVVRHADPVQVGRAGDAAGFPLAFFRKVERVTAGAWVYVGAGGRAELLWPADGTTAVLYNTCNVVIGEPSRDEPTLIFRTITRARLVLTPEDRVELLGGAILRGDPVEESGPFLLDKIGPEILRVQNQSKRMATVAFRDQDIVVSPGQLVDLSVLPDEAGGTRPVQEAPGLERYETRAFGVSTRGPVAAEDLGSGLSLSALGENEVRGQGLQLELLPGERVVFGDLGPLPGSQPGPQPASQPISEPPPELEAPPGGPDPGAPAGVPAVPLEPGTGSSDTGSEDGEGPPEGAPSPIPGSAAGPPG